MSSLSPIVYFTDINECELGTHRCHEFAYCVDKSAGYDCICSDDYVGNGYKCVLPVDECALGTDECPEETVCVNTDGSFNCECIDIVCPNPDADCAEGYEKDADSVCVDIDECSTLENVCENGQCVNIDGDYTCDCDLGYHLLHPDTLHRLGRPAGGRWHCQPQ